MESFTTDTPIPLTSTDWSSSVPLTLFDPSLGTLQSVDLYVSSTLQTTLTVQNSADSASSGTAKTEVQVSVDGNPALDFLSPAFSYSLARGWEHQFGLLQVAVRPIAALWMMGLNRGSSKRSLARVPWICTRLRSRKRIFPTPVETPVLNQVTDASFYGYRDVRLRYA